MAANTLADMGLIDPELTRKKRAAPLSLAKQTLRKAILGHESAAADAHELHHMLQSVQRRQKLKLGAVVAVRAIKFTVGVAETEQFADKQRALVARNAPHYSRLAKTVGLHTQTVVWTEETMDQDEFVTELVLSHPSEDHALHQDDYSMKRKGYVATRHDELQARVPTEPGLVVWTRKRPEAVHVVQRIEVSYTATDATILQNDGYERIEQSLAGFGFGDMHFWLKKANRNKPPVAENKTSLLQELKQARRLLDKHPGDPIVLHQQAAIMQRLSVVDEHEEFTNKYKGEPLKYAIEFLAVTQKDLEMWMTHFERIDTEQLGLVTTLQLLQYCGLRQCTIMDRVFELLCETSDDEGRLDFGESVKALGSFCFFGKEDLLHFVYTTFDADENGYITHQELLALLSDLHTATNRGRTTRALREITLLDDGKLTYSEFIKYNTDFPNLFYPAFDFQWHVRKTFFGVPYWERKLRRYARIKADLLNQRSDNTDKWDATVAKVEKQREDRKKKVARTITEAQQTQSVLKRGLLTAQATALQFALKHDIGTRSRRI